MKNKSIPSIKTDYKNRFNRKLWLAERKRDLRLYFDSRNMIHGKFENEPFWSVVPRTSLWHIPSLGTPGFDGWYGIAGDHPTDVVPLNYFEGDIRKILDHFVKKWLHAAEKLKQGEDYGDFRIENIKERPIIGQLIEDRATRLERFVAAEELWTEQTLVWVPPAPVPDDEIESD
ncbi:DUF4826 family protein [Reinekea marina]|uniref:DUF4826 family protein n=1 Tax=Reinekea marina TaxID=1310421 RepID=A0ABV7WLD8_9GAMM|nr:DUF4826 family protein [Reinekea marina]MDN3650773.1 DUF4826 family protein [Reinekea marina]